MSLYQTAGDSGGGRALAWRDDDSHPVVTASPHGAASRIHHEAHEKPAGRRSEAKSRTEISHLPEEVLKLNVEV